MAFELTPELKQQFLTAGGAELDEVLARQGSLTGEQTFQKALRDYAAGNLGASFQGTQGTGTIAEWLQGPQLGAVDQFGRQNYSTSWNVAQGYGTAASLQSQLFPTQQQQYEQNLQKVQDIYKQTTGQNLTGQGLETVTLHLQKGDDPMQALSNLGNLNWWAKNTTSSGEPLAYAGAVNESGYAIPGAESVAERMARTGETAAEIQYQQSLLPAAQEFANQLPQPQQAIPMDSMGQTPQQISLPNVPASTNQALSDAMVTGGETSISQIMKSLDPNASPLEQKQFNLLDEIANLTGDASQRAADQLTAEQSAGLPELRQQFADINAQILEKSARYNVLKTENQNKPITMSSIIGNERAIMNAEAADIGLLQAQALGLQGRIQDAQATVDRAIDLKYATIDAQLAVKQAQLNAIQPLLDKQEREEAIALQRQYQEEQQRIEEQKSKEKQLQSLMLGAISQGITDRGILDQIANAPDIIEAARLVQTNIPVAPIVSGGGIDSGGISSTGVSTPTQSFEEFIRQKEQQLGMNLANPEEYRDEYSQTVGQIEQQALNLLSDRAKNVYENPKLINNYTATEKGKITDEIASAGLDAGRLIAAQLNSTAIKEISQTQDALDSLYDLQQKISLNSDKIGPITGLEALNPWSEKRKILADIDRIRQTVGKALEGGVLRKEDEEKYKKILATITDTPSTAEYKITQLIADIQSNIDNYTQLQGLPQGYVGDLLGKDSSSQLTEEQAYQEYLNIVNQ